MKNGLYDDLVAAKTHWKHRYSTSGYYHSRLKSISVFEFYLYSAHNSSIYETDAGPFEKFRDYWTKLLVLGLVYLPTGKLQHIFHWCLLEDGLHSILLIWFLTTSLNLKGIKNNARLLQKSENVNSIHTYCARSIFTNKR